MSTKTLRKRIALVAVSALGFGLVSSVPAANAAVTGKISVLGQSVSRAGASTTIDLAAYVLATSGSVTNVANDAFTARTLTVPAGSAIEVGDKFQSQDAGVASAVSATTAQTITIGRANDRTLSGSSGSKTAAVTAVTAADGASNLNVGDTVTGGYDPNGDGTYTTAGGDIEPTGATSDYVTVAGTYTFGVWYDLNGDGLLNSGEEATSYTTVSVAVGGAPVLLSVTPDSTVVPAGSVSTVYIKATDSAGNATLVSGSEEIGLSVTQLTGTSTVTIEFDDASPDTSSDSLVAADGADASDGPIANGLDAYPVYFLSTVAGSIDIKANFLGSLNPLATAASSGAITINSVSYATKIAVKEGTTGVTEDSATAYAFPKAVTDADLTNSTPVDNAINASTSKTSITYVVSGTAGSRVNVEISDNGGTLPTGIYAGTTPLLIGADGTAEFTVATSSTSVTAARTYKIYVASDANDGQSYSVTFEAAAVADASIAISPDVEKTNVTTIVALPGSTNSFTVTVADQFGTKYNNYAVQLTTSSTQRNASKTIVASTDANGLATVALADASTSTTNTSDAVVFNVFAPGSTVDLENATISMKYSSAAPYTLGLTGGTTSTVTAKEAAPTTETLTADNTIALTSSLKDVTSLAAVNGVLLTYTGTEGVKFASSATPTNTVGTATYSVASDTTTVYAYGTKTGVATVTVTGPSGLTATQTFTVTAAASTARNISAVAAGSATVKNTVVGTVSAVVTDGWGNALVGVTVKFSRLGKGRFAGGASTTTAETDATGKAVAEVVANVDELGDMVVTASLDAATYTQADDLKETPVLAFAAASGSASATLTWTQGVPEKSAELLAIEAIAAKAAADKAESDAKIAALEAQIAANKATTDAAIAAAQAAAVAAAEAAADAAAEAIDAGNNAFDAATSAGEAADAATAAAEQAGEDATAAANAAGEAAVAAAEAATEAAAEATDAANAATDAANASAEAADAATAAAQDAADAVAALSTQVSEMISALKKQITALTNLVIKIQKKVKA